MKPLKVAIIGAGAAGLYAVQHLLDQLGTNVEIDVIERLPTPWGLVRSGVAPDHPEKKQIADRLFQLLLEQDNVRFFGNVELGADLSPAEVAQRYHAVIYANGTDADRKLGIEGEDMAGSWPARQFVGWYNGHPDFTRLDVDLSASQAVIIGNGNVALDVARILTVPVNHLARTDIADHALAALAHSRVDDVVILGRRGARHAAFHNPELEELFELDDVSVTVEADDLTQPADDCDWKTQRKLQTLLRLQGRKLTKVRKRIHFRFHHVPLALAGAQGKVTGILVQRGGEQPATLIPCGLVLSAIGFRGTPMEGVPFDDAAGTISHDAGRIVNNGTALPGLYAAGWIKRGPRGVIGSNKRCAEETVAQLLWDIRTDKLKAPNGGDILPLLAQRGCQFVSKAGWRRIDTAERNAGRVVGRPRIKRANVEGLLDAAKPERPENPASPIAGWDI